MWEAVTGQERAVATLSEADLKGFEARMRDWGERDIVGILAAVLSFGFIVFIHELGHFLAARWAGIRCPQFAIGFGPKLFAFEFDGILQSFHRALKLLQDDRAETMARKALARLLEDSQRR